MSRWPLTHKENVSCINRQCKVNPVHVVISFKQSSVLKSHILLALSQKISYEWIEHLLRSYMSYKATFSLSQRWPLNTGFTLRILSENIRKNIRALPGRKARLWRGFSPVSQRLQINYIFFWQCTYIVFILQCKKYPKQLANFLKREKNKIFDGVLCEVRDYIRLPFLTVAQHESGTRKKHYFSHYYVCVIVNPHLVHSSQIFVSHITWHCKPETHYFFSTVKPVLRRSFR